MDVGAAIHSGYVRTDNEDALFASRELSVFAVADGMGGHAHGEVASRLAVAVAEQRAQAIARSLPGDLPQLLDDTLQAANSAILAEALSQDDEGRMGSTMVLATVCGDRLYFAHIGDSRLYLLRANLFTQLTRDHSLVQTMVDRGEISAQEAAIHPLRHQITRAVGGEDYISPEIASQALEPGDVVLLCTDGLTGAVPQDQIKAILASHRGAQQKADALVQAALAAGGPDNVAVVVASYQRPRPVPSKEHRKRVASFWLSLWVTVITLAIVAAVVAICAYERPSYYVRADDQGVLGLYRRWPVLFMLRPQRVETAGVPPVLLEDAKPHLVRYGDIHNGIPVDGKEAGTVFLKDIVNKTISRLFEETKTSLEEGRVEQARRSLARAREMGGDAATVQQLERMIEQAEKSAPRKEPEP